MSQELDIRTEYQRRFAQAVIETNLAGIWFGNAAPPYVRLLKNLGFEPRLPHYVPFWRAALTSGIAFALAWGAALWAFVWDKAATPPSVAIMHSLIAGAIFGLFMALYYLYGRKRYGLKRWEDL